MAMSIIDGSNTFIDLDVAGNSLNCFMGYMSGDFVREFSEQTTFCTEGWRSRTPGLKQLLGRLDGYLAKGEAGTNPAAYIASTATMAFILTWDDGTPPCTYTFDGHVGRVHTGVRAAANSEFSIDFESYGIVTTAWITV